MSTLTKKHFECIARHLRRSAPERNGSKLGYYLAVTAMANALAEINPRFERARFIQACVPSLIEDAQLGAGFMQAVEEIPAAREAVAQALEA